MTRSPSRRWALPIFYARTTTIRPSCTCPRPREAVAHSAAAAAAAVAAVGTRHRPPHRPRHDSSLPVHPEHRHHLAASSRTRAATRVTLATRPPSRWRPSCARCSDSARAPHQFHPPYRRHRRRRRRRSHHQAPMRPSHRTLTKIDTSLCVPCFPTPPLASRAPRRRRSALAFRHLASTRPPPTPRGERRRSRSARLEVSWARTLVPRALVVAVAPHRSAPRSRSRRCSVCRRRLGASRRSAHRQLPVHRSKRPSRTSCTRVPSVKRRPRTT